MLGPALDHGVGGALKSCPGIRNKFNIIGLKGRRRGHNGKSPLTTASGPRSNCSQASGRNSAPLADFCIDMPKPSFPTEIDDPANAYLNILFEVNARLNFMNSIQDLNLPDGILREMCQLNLRHICELTAIGCVVLQGDYRSFRSFREADNPRHIFLGLSKIHTGFFSMPATITKNDDPLGVLIEGHGDTNAMTRSELELLWSKTGNFLHRLTATSFFRPEDRSDEDMWPDYRLIIKRLRLLLDSQYNNCKGP